MSYINSIYDREDRKNTVRRFDMIRRKTTREIFGESLHELARKKPVDKITVKDIADNCGMSIATFYRYFHDKYELAAWIYNYQAEDIFMDFREGNESWRQVIYDIVRILDNDREFYRNALKNKSGQNSFFNATHQHSIELVTEEVKKRIDSEDDDEILFDVKFYLRGMSYSVDDWFLNNLPYSADEIADYLYRAIPEKLKPYLR